jgi:8-oxo-dGTP diphosphatase
MARSPIYAAGGIVVRGRARPLIAVVQRSKDERWVLPRGKLKRDENPMVGARREVVEETGHQVQVHEFLGAISYRVRGRAKLVQFWRMQANERPSRDIMSDIAAVEWLPLGEAVRRLSYPLERLFLHYAGRRALKHRKAGGKRKGRARRKTRSAKRRTLKARRKHRPAIGQRRRLTATRRSVSSGARARRRGSVLRRMLGRLGR